MTPHTPATRPPMRGRTARAVLAGGLGAAAGVVLVLPPMQAGGGVFAAGGG